ncbi:sulfurtransferase [Roseivirga sp.]|uniref:sulfurtransferase n=1 Tax=Roseivirga sp. TaxID=1964215 RepID=UPI003B52B252
MKNFRTLLLLFVFGISLSANAQRTDYSQTFVDQAWMQEHIDDQDLVILHVANPNTYQEGHLKGALSIVPQQYTVVRGDLYWELPEEEALADTLQNFGINNESTIVLYYGGTDHAATFRLFFTLDYYGVSDQVKILDGGLKGWKANNLPLSTTPVERTRAEEPVKLKAVKKRFADKSDVLKAQKKSKIQLIDARRDVYYNGTEQGDYGRPGHIATAANICWLDIVDENMFLKDKATLSAYYTGIGLQPNSQVMSYCHVGLRASVIYTIAKYLGYDARLYDGSYNEYDTLDESYAVEK